MLSRSARYDRNVVDYRESSRRTLARAAPPSARGRTPCGTGGAWRAGRGGSRPGPRGTRRRGRGSTRGGRRRRTRRSGSAGAARIARSASERTQPATSLSAGRWVSVSRTSRATSATHRPDPAGPARPTGPTAPRPRAARRRRASWNHAASRTADRVEGHAGGRELVEPVEHLGQVPGVVVAARRSRRTPRAARRAASSRPVEWPAVPQVHGSIQPAQLRRERRCVQDDQRGDRAGQADVEPAQPGHPVRLAGRRSRPARPGRRGRTRGPSPATPAPGRGAARTRSPRSLVADHRGRGRVRGRQPQRLGLGRAASGAISPIEPSRATRRRPGRPRRQVRARSTRDRSPRAAAHRRRRGQRRARSCGSSRAAYSITSPGTRKPRVSSSTWASGLPRWAERLGPGAGRPGRGRLGQVAEHGQRPGRGAPGQRAQHHRREVLRLVGHDVAPATGCARPGRPPRRGVRRPAATSGPRRASRGGFAHSSAACSSGSRIPSAAAGEEVRRRTAAATRSRAGSTAGHSSFDVVLDRLAARHGVLHPVVGGVAGELHLHQDPVRQRLRQHRPGGAVPDPARCAATATISSASYAATRHRRAPARHDQPFGRVVRRATTARARAPSAIRASPLSVATAAGSSPRIAFLG